MLRRLEAVLLIFLTFGSVSVDARQVRPLPETAKPSASDRILIVAPHIDDEAIAAAGYVSAARAAGAEVFIVYLTAGDCNHTSARMLGHTLSPKPAVFLQLGKQRYGEALEATGRMKVPRSNVFLLGYPDGGLRAMLDDPDKVVRSRGTARTEVPYAEAVKPGSAYRLENLVRDLDGVLKATRPTVVLLPVTFDSHSDHSATGEITQHVVAASGMAPRLLGYLVHASRFPVPFRPAASRPLDPPLAFARKAWTVFPLTTEQELQKKRVLQAYRSQREDPYLYLLTGAFVRRNELFVDLSARK
ncbi:MAG TPA: PIG-L family deacetylase [Thermoanaerobaculia bacterium]|jgi:LmbE family N-acetylglucosaminyl deacetylase|nr:PIG-L family deacetylase [Thermoanaerobaculia bacterium]